MNTVARDIFQAIHEGKWLKIEYKNKEEQITKYWIGICDINVRKRSLSVEGLHLGQYSVCHFDCIFIDSIRSSQVIEGSYCPINQKLIEDISLNPHKYKTVFDHIPNLKILNYLETCNRMDTVPYYDNFELIRYIDRDSFNGESYQLSQEQFREIVKHFEYKMEKAKPNNGRLTIQRLAINVLSIHTNRGLYALAYRKLNLDVKRHVLRPDEEITLCTEFKVEGKKESIRYYLDAEEYELLNDFENNQEKIKNIITARNRQIMGVDDMPYIIGIGTDIALDLHDEYKAIIEMYHKGEVTFPMKAFFGDLLERPRRSKTYPIALINKNINLDQLLAIHNAMKYPVAYIQGPPGTGKTNTIINTIVTAFFNNRTVLFSSYNNVPIDTVFYKLSNLEYHGNIIPFPVLRLGNDTKIREAIVYIKKLYEKAQGIPVYDTTLDKRKGDRIARAKALSDMLKRYEDMLELTERSETLQRLLEYQNKKGNEGAMIPFQADLQGRQLEQVKREMEKIGTVTEQDALNLLDQNEEEFFQYLYYTSVRYIKQLGQKKYEDFMGILDMEEGDKQTEAFRRYFKNAENVKKMQKVFPIMITTCISAHRIGEPKPLFHMVILDEASQCNTAVSLVPIIRGENVMLVGDPQQLNPVILLGEVDNLYLRKKYHITDEYDYRKNSIYKTYLACDSVSDEILLHNHYRCHKKIIEFNNRKYYNSRLNICSSGAEEEPLVYIDVQNGSSTVKNTAPEEVRAMIYFAKLNKEKSIGVITPFVNQRKLIEDAIKQEHLENISCGTVHAFQGDEKDIVLFSTAISEQTQAGTYAWLKNNKELINVATSRAKDKLVVLSDMKNVNRLHESGDDDLYELIDYVQKNGETKVTQKQANSRALGVKPFSTATEEAFLANLSHALENIWMSRNRYVIHKEVPISQVFEENVSNDSLFYMGRFDFVVYEKQQKDEIPMLAIELDGKEHFQDEAVKRRDQQKNEICRAHHLQIIRVENSYARRYNHIKEILMDYFEKRR